MDALYPRAHPHARSQLTHRQRATGGGSIAASKLSGLLRAGARVTVVAPRVLPKVKRSRARILQRRFRASDLEGAWLAVAAAPASVNAQVYRAATERNIFVNSVDDPKTASAYAGATVRTGDLQIAISTGGRAPALAGLVREAIETILPKESGRWVRHAAALRKEWKARGIPMKRRRPLLLDSLNALYSGRSSKEAVS